MSWKTVDDRCCSQPKPVWKEFVLSRGSWCSAITSLGPLDEPLNELAGKTALAISLRQSTGGLGERGRLFPSVLHAAEVSSWGE